MSWRRGELWFDADVLWFRESAGTPALVGLPPPPVAFGSPSGLMASRQRRAAWKRKRRARRTGATILAVSPAAVVLGLAGLRAASDPTSGVMVSDPASETVRVAKPRPSSGLRRASPSPNRVVTPTIEWHHATSTGLPYRGELIDGTQLPVEGPDWITWDPVADSTPNLPNRLYGNERTIRAILAVTHAYREAHPEAPRVVVGDISRKGGGPMTDEHVSHQNGLDVDVYFPRRDRALRTAVAPSEVDRELTQDIVDRFVAAGAQMIFVGRSTGLRGPVGVVIPYEGHDYHMHVRFPPAS